MPVNVHLFPWPRKASFENRKLDFTGAEWIRVAPGLSDGAKRHAIEFADAVRDRFLRPLTVTAGDPHSGRVFLKVGLAGSGIPPQGYRLTAGPDGVTLEGADEAGVFYGLQTLRQIVEQTGAAVPAFRLSDHPDFPQRGVMLDVSRLKVPTMETLSGLVDLLASLKVNHLELYTEHTFAYSEHEAVWHDASPLTPQEVLELDAYCRARHVELVPNQNSFGHFERWLRHPEYRHLAECPDGFEYPWGGRSGHGSTLKPGRDSLKLLGSLYDELLPNFTSPSFNVGCDETWELGQGRSKTVCERKGKTRVYLEFLKKIHKLVRGHGRTMLFWGDIILHDPELIPELPDNTVALEWGYEFDHDFPGRCARFKAAGVPFYVCPGTSSWNSLSGRTANCLGNIANAARNGLRQGAIGLLNTDWGDNGHLQHLPFSYLGFAAGAAFSWCLKTNEKADVADALNRWVFRDEGGETGRLFVEAGKVLELVPKRFQNGSPFSRLLLGRLGDPGLLEGVTAAQLRRCVREFDKLERRTAAARPGVPDAGLILAEFANGLAMARHGARRGLLALGKPDLDPDALRHELQHIIAEHRRLWLARNRPGGLRDSSGYLRKALAEIG